MIKITHWHNFVIPFIYVYRDFFKMRRFNMIYDLLLLEKNIWNLPLLITLLCFLVVYISYSIRKSIDMKKISLFCFGLALVYITIGSPLAMISRLSFSLHMIQMSVLYFIIPPMLISSIPPFYIKHPHLKSRIQKLHRYLLTPKMALACFSVLFLIYHFPLTITFMTQHPMLQSSLHVILFVLACRMWWPLASPSTYQHQYNLKKYSYLSGILIMPACLIFIVSALFNQTNNSFLSEFTAFLCLPATAEPLQLLPYPFQTNIDQMMAGIFMLGIHKMSLAVTVKRITKSTSLSHH